MIVPAMKLGLSMIAVLFGVAALAATASACGYHGVKATTADNQTSAGQMTTTATTTGKTTGG
jgi:hypothetical protein